MRNKKLNIPHFSNFLYGIALVSSMFLAGSYRVIGYVGFGVLLIINVTNTFKKKWAIHTSLKLTLITLLNIVFLFFHLFFSIFLNNIYSTTIYSFLVQLMIYAFIFLQINSNNIININDITIISKVFSIIFILILFLIYINDEKLFYQSSFFESQLGILMLPAMSFFLLSTNKKFYRLLFMVLSGVVIYLSTRRGPLLAYVAFVITYIFWDKITSHKKAYIAYFYVILSLSIITPFIYLSLSQPGSELGSIVNIFTIKYTGSRLFSGREDIWPYVIDMIKSRPLWGSGIGVNLLESSSIEVSAHNLFLFIVLQTGIIGLFLFIQQLYQFWICYFQRNQYSKVFGSLLVSIIIQQVFSLGLLSGKMALALSVWTLFSFGTYRLEK